MARKSLIARSKRAPKYPTRNVSRCEVVWRDRPCGRARGFMRRFRMCRICFRTLANQGKLPGVRKSSW